MSEELTYSNYKKEIRKLHKLKKIQDDEHHRNVVILLNKYNIQPKETATFEELCSLIGIVLETGLNGTKAIRKYAEESNKTEEWINEIARPKAGKLFRMALNRYENNAVILSMKANEIYDERGVFQDSCRVF